MSKFLIVNTTTYAASGVGSVPARWVLGVDEIVTFVPNSNTKVNIVYPNVTAVLEMSGTFAVGDYSVITFLTKQIEILQKGQAPTLSLPTTFPNCFTTVGHPLGIIGITVIGNPCCTP